MALDGGHATALVPEAVPLVRFFVLNQVHTKR